MKQIKVPMTIVEIERVRFALGVRVEECGKNEGVSNRAPDSVSAAYWRGQREDAQGLLDKFERVWKAEYIKAVIRGDFREAEKAAGVA